MHYSNVILTPLLSTPSLSNMLWTAKPITKPTKKFMTFSELGVTLDEACGRAAQCLFKVGWGGMHVDGTSSGWDIGNVSSVQVQDHMCFLLWDPHPHPLPPLFGWSFISWQRRVLCCRLRIPITVRTTDILSGHYTTSYKHT